jgi:hypothetical protein
MNGSTHLKSFGHTTAGAGTMKWDHRQGNGPVAKYIAINRFKIIWRSKEARVVIANTEFHVLPLHSSFDHKIFGLESRSRVRAGYHSESLVGVTRKLFFGKPPNYCDWFKTCQKIKQADIH